MIEDATNDPRTRDNPLVTGQPGIRFYAGVPLRLSGGEALGTLCGIDLVPRRLTDDMMENLRALGRQACGLIELRLKVSQLEESTQAARRAEEAKSKFLANMSHEIRTPLAAIVGYADVLGTAGVESVPGSGHGTDKPGIDAGGAARSIALNARHLLGLINDVLDLSRIEAGRMSVELVPTDPLGVLADLASLLGTSAVDKGLTITVRADTEVPGRIISDPMRLRQVLLNVVGNAVKFTQRGGIEIRIAWSETDGTLAFAISDTGIGMSPEQLERVREFRAFTQADGSTSRRYGGSGLGLRISASIAELLGGSLSISSSEGSGTTTTVVVSTGGLVPAERLRLDGPLRLADIGVCGRAREGERCASSHEAGVVSGCGTAAQTGGLLSGVRILLVDDGLDNRRLIAHFLERAGARVAQASSGREAIGLLVDTAGTLPDVVLMDMQMPDIDGYQATAELRRRGLRIPVIAITANALAADRERCLVAGCTDYISKPVDWPALIATCRRLTMPGVARSA